MPDTFEITLASRDAAWLNKKFLEEGFAVSSVTPKQRTLKEFFLSITTPKTGTGTREVRNS